MIDRTLCLIVTHNGAHTIRGLLDTIVASGLPLLVIDNGSHDETLTLLASLCPARCKILSRSTNEGVASAFNLGLATAAARNKEWLLILDQDSRCGPGMADGLLEAANRLMTRGMRLGAVCPTIRSRLFPEIVHSPYHWQGRRFEVMGDGPKTPDEISRIDSTITSGTLYRVAALQNVGGFRENYFIDFVDHECHLRLRRAGWSLWWVRKAVLYQRLGSVQRMTAGGLWIEHEPFRYYYMARNMLEGHWRMGGPLAALAMLGEIGRHILRLLRHGRRPSTCTLFILKGVLHALCGRSGKLASDH